VIDYLSVASLLLSTLTFCLQVCLHSINNSKYCISLNCVVNVNMCKWSGLLIYKYLLSLYIVSLVLNMCLFFSFSTMQWIQVHYPNMLCIHFGTDVLRCVLLIIGVKNNIFYYKSNVCQLLMDRCFHLCHDNYYSFLYYVIL